MTKKKLAEPISPNRSIAAMAEMLVQQRLDELVAEVRSGSRTQITIDEATETTAVVPTELSQRWH